MMMRTMMRTVHFSFCVFFCDLHADVHMMHRRLSTKRCSIDIPEGKLLNAAHTQRMPSQSEASGNMQQWFAQFWFPF